MGNLFSPPENHSTRPQVDSNHTDTNNAHTFLAVQPSAHEAATLPIPLDNVTVAPVQAANNPSSAGVQYAPYTVFISHGGEDKATIAIPLREKLYAKGITAFVDDADLECGKDAIQAMTFAMETARIGVIILSPEFIAKEWPMRELMHFLKRRQDCSRAGHSGPEAPTIIPCFYRLSVADLYQEPKLDRKDENGTFLYERTRFFERLMKGDPEADLKNMVEALRSLHRITGIENVVDANNDSDYVMTKKRGLLLDKLCSEICKHVPESMRMRNIRDSAQGRNHETLHVDSFRRSFPRKLTGVRAVLDFDSRNADGSPTTPEGEIKQHLLAENRGSAGVISLCGAGGMGKSTIVEALMNDDDVRKRFADGVHLIKLGSDASKTALLDGIHCILKISGAKNEVQSLRERNDTKEAIEVFMKWFEGKRCVFFIDDVWKHCVDVQALSLLSDIVRSDGGNMVMITTREDEIALLTHDARSIRLDVRDSRGEVSRKMLFFYAGVDENNVDTTDAADAISGILDICAGLPVSLAVAGKNVRKLSQNHKKHGKSVWVRYVSRLRANREVLLQEDVGRYGNLYATLLASLDFLDDAIIRRGTGVQTRHSFKGMHRRLCVLQKQASVPNRMLMHLWETKSEEDAEMIAERFAEVGLGDYWALNSEIGRKSVFSLHDSVHDFAVSEARRHGEIVKAHEVLVKGYGSRHDAVCEESGDKKKVRWWSQELEDDGYIHKELCRHLVESRRKSELCELLLTPLWAHRQLEVNGMMCVEEDFGTGLKEAVEDEETKQAFRLIANAVGLSLVHLFKNKSELWFQLHGRLIGWVGSNRVIEEYLKRMEHDWAKPRVLCVNRGVLAGAGGRNAKIIPTDGYIVRCMSLFPDEERVACGCSDGRVIVINIRRSEIQREWQAYEEVTDRVSNAVRSLAVSQNGTRIVTTPARTFESGSLHIWNVGSGDRVMPIGDGTAAVRCFSITRDESCVVCVSEEGLLQSWKLSSGEMVAAGINVGDSATDIALFKDDERAILGYRNGKLRIWNIRTGTLLEEFGTISSGIRILVVTPDERRVVSCLMSGEVTLWNLESLQQGSSSKADGFNIRAAVSKDGSRIAIGDGSGGIKILDVESGNEVCEPLQGHTGFVTGVSFLQNKDFIVSSSEDRTIRVWDTARVQNDTSINRHGDAVGGVSFTPDGNFVVTGSHDHTLRVWDVVTEQAVGDPLRGHSSWVRDVAVTPDGRFVISVSLDKTAIVWDLYSRELLDTFKGHTGPVECVAVTPKGDRVVTGSWDKTVRIWDLEQMNGNHTVLKGHVDHVVRVFVSDDGLRVISVDVKDNIFVWSIGTKEKKRVVEKDAWTMSRREVFSLVEENTVHDEVELFIRLASQQIMHGKQSGACVLATLESNVLGWGISPDKKTICLGLEDGRVVCLKVDV